MKIHTYYSDKLPKGTHVIEWRAATEVCDERGYELRSRQNAHPATNWFRNMVLANVEHKTDTFGRAYTMYHITYERKEEYFVADIPPSALTPILKANTDLGIVYRDGKLWLEYIGD